MQENYEIFPVQSTLNLKKVSRKSTNKKILALTQSWIVFPQIFLLLIWSNPSNNNKSFTEESKQIVPNQTAPLGAVWYGTILFVYDFLVGVISTYTGRLNTYMPGRVAQSVTCLATDACLTADPGVASSIPVRSHTFVEIDHEMNSTVILLPSADSFKNVVVSYKRKYVHKLLVNRLFKPAQEKVWLGELTVPQWPSMLTWDVKQQNKQTNKQYLHVEKYLFIQLKYSVVRYYW